MYFTPTGQPVNPLNRFPCIHQLGGAVGRFAGLPARRMPAIRTTLNKEIHNETTELSRHRSAGRLEFGGELDMYGKAYVFPPETI